MYMRTEILKIIEGGMDKNYDKVRSYAVLLAKKLREEGEEKFSDRIMDVLSKRNSAHPVYLDEFASKPIDQDSRFDMLDVYMPENNETTLVIPELIRMKLDDYISALIHRDKFIELGLSTTDSLLLYGPPGCGKTSMAHYISFRTGLPLVIAKLDAIVSSLLGNTAKNLRRVFDYAKGRPCILFLDEFDAIAKSRTDDQEVGELKRVVNSLLQNIDEFTSSNILIAATNHETMLDTAVWRRFTNVIEVAAPNESDIINLLTLYLSNIECDFITNQKRLKIIGQLMAGMSPADIKTVCNNAIKKSIICGHSMLTFGIFLYQMYLFRGFQANDITLPQYLRMNGLTQLEISETLGISIRQVRNILLDLEDKHGTEESTH